MGTQGAGGFMHVCVKLLFAALVVMHVVMLPCALTIFAALTYGALVLGQVGKLMMGSGEGLRAGLANPGLLLIHGEGRHYGAVSAIYTLYFGAFFFAFISHEALLLPVVTNWVYPKYNYTFTERDGGRIPGAVTDVGSIEMRSHPFTWARSYDFEATRVAGAIIGMGADGPLQCGLPDSRYQCVAPKMLTVTPPTGDYAKRPFVPLPSAFYDIDVRVTPGSFSLPVGLFLCR
jgi:hypothetical protein